MYDVIIGGGPAGSTLATYTAQAGLKTTIFESHNHPLPHVGESMVTSTRCIQYRYGKLCGQHVSKSDQINALPRLFIRKDTKTENKNKNSLIV